MKAILLFLCCAISYLGFGQSIDQITFTGEAELLLELSHRFKSNYLTLSHHEYRMAFTEKFTYTRNLPESTSQMERFHGYNWGVEIFPDFDDDGSLSKPIGFDYKGGLYFSRLIDKEGRYHSTVNYLNTNYKIYEDIIPGLDRSTLHSGAIAKNEKFMVLSLNEPFTHGMEDLYVIEYTEGGWKNLINLGSVVNSKDQDITPYLAIDNKTLFFASNRKGGKGGFDIYVTQRLNDTWKEWTTPVNVVEINTSASETSFCLIDTDPYAYFIRAEINDVYGDIMQAPIKQQFEEAATFVEITDLAENGSFKVVDGVSESSIPIELYIEDEQENQIEQSGTFEIEQFRGKTLVVKSKGYFSIKIKIDDRIPEGESIIYLAPLTVGSNITLENVLFERATPRILPSSYEQLDLLIDVLNENPSLNIQLQGHTDNKGNPISNLELSQKRVDAVTAYLRDRGISKKRISGVGYGGQYPIASNETEETRRLNRRVEFEIVE